jgi:hypothetical protein
MLAFNLRVASPVGHSAEGLVESRQGQSKGVTQDCRPMSANLLGMFSLNTPTKSSS